MSSLGTKVVHGVCAVAVQIIFLIHRCSDFQNLGKQNVMLKSN